MKIRQGIKEDLPQVLDLIKELALYEKAPDEVDNTVEKMTEDGFGERPIFEFFVAEGHGKIIGLALYYYRYSTWKGKALYLEDIIVTDAHRNKGIGKLLFDKVVEKAQQENLNRISWQVLDWNGPAINFYKKLNASFDGEWVNCWLDKEQIEKHK